MITLECTYPALAGPCPDGPQDITIQHRLYLSNLPRACRVYSVHEQILGVMERCSFDIRKSANHSIDTPQHPSLTLSSPG